MLHQESGSGRGGKVGELILMLHKKWVQKKNPITVDFDGFQFIHKCNPNDK